MYFAETCIIRISYRTRWWIEITNICLREVMLISSTDLLHKSHNAPVPYPTMQCFVTEICTSVHLHAIYAIFSCVCVVWCCVVCGVVWCVHVLCVCCACAVHVRVCVCLGGLIPVDFPWSHWGTVGIIGLSQLRWNKPGIFWYQSFCFYHKLQVRTTLDKRKQREEYF